MDNFMKKIQMAKEGKEIFKKKFQVSDLNINDCFILVLTRNKECIYHAARYLPDFVALYEKTKAYILLTDPQYTPLFFEAGGTVRICTGWELDRLAEYFNLFHHKDEVVETRILFLTEKDPYGLLLENLLQKKEFSVEEYVAISLYQLKGLREG